MPLPLPLRGLFSEARNAEMSIEYAGEVTNWRSTGVSLETRPGYKYLKAETFPIVLQRVPFEFGAISVYIELSATTAMTPSVSTPRVCNGNASFSALSGQVIIADGIGDPLAFNGSTFSTPAFTTSTSVTQSDFDGFLAHHDRPYFWVRGSTLEFYYGGVGAVTGALTQFPLDRLGNITGSILEMASLTVDAGHGMNDVLAIFTSTGQVVTYEGLDPGDQNDWRQLNRLQIAPPLGPKAFQQIGSDLWVLTPKGVVSIQQTISQGQMALVKQVSQPVADDLVQAAEDGGDWILHASADQRMVIINRVFAGVSEQWVFYTKSGTWEKSDYPALDWHNLAGNTEFTAMDGRPARLTTSKTDGDEMTAVLRTGWFRSGFTSIESVTPSILAKGPLSVRLAVLVDHDETAADLDESWQTVTIEPETPASGGETIALNELIASDAVGDVFQIRMEVTAKWAQLVNMTLRVT
ncbi:hypothetical protein [Mameliella alba]|uniref:Uncharacterized protein n=1 Tax=Mameliella alba TaxID=561184 RepID=A0A0B3SKL9_9RHOB|nr:hypothetical protein [Mameliella alba]KHQ51099.1 hypothetical protein OA50_04470 [Mameliella alba]